MPRLLVNIDVPDLAAGEAFYTAALGFGIGRRFGTAVTEMTGGDAPLCLIARPEREYARHWTPVHLDLVVDDLDAAVARVISAGATAEGGIRLTGYGRIATFADPFGHGLCLIQFSRRVMMPSPIEMLRVPVLSDNYVWLMHDVASNETVAIDPSVAEPVLAAAAARGWRIGQIWNTHWHPDHTGGNSGIKAATGCIITGPAAEAAKIPTLDRTVAEGDEARIGAHVARVIEVPAHTAGHIAFHMADDAIVFVGDTLFAMGCGRLFEGTAAQMFANMRRLAALPPETTVYCAHEYTESNGLYARVAEPDNRAIADRMDFVLAARARGEATVPTTIALELATNPFMRAASAAQLAERRAAKDSFRG